MTFEEHLSERQVQGQRKVRPAEARDTALLWSERESIRACTGIARVVPELGGDCSLEAAG